jgi:hypothetical protein
MSGVLILQRVLDEVRNRDATEAIVNENKHSSRGDSRILR